MNTARLAAAVGIGAVRGGPGIRPHLPLLAFGQCQLRLPALQLGWQRVGAPRPPRPGGAGPLRSLAAGPPPP
ncbi:hypothetical protein, partial [Stenotrophomonas sp. PS02297]|uniref:hypothetical protein n=1 Tax=Stenotrophomonas sp. PS02297 TaxID=2991423 RepID=UPI002499E0DD